MAVHSMDLHPLNSSSLQSDLGQVLLHARCPEGPPKCSWWHVLDDLVGICWFDRLHLAFDKLEGSPAVITCTPPTSTPEQQQHHHHQSFRGVTRLLDSPMALLSTRTSFLADRISLPARANVQPRDTHIAPLPPRHMYSVASATPVVNSLSTHNPALCKRIATRKFRLQTPEPPGNNIRPSSGLCSNVGVSIRTHNDPPVQNSSLWRFAPHKARVQATSRQNRGIRGDDKGLTSTRIRYSSPPPREGNEVLQYLTDHRQRNAFRPRHTPPDVCAAQDVALGKPRVLDLAIRSAQSSRRDSGVNDDLSTEKTKDVVPALEANDDDLAVKPLPPCQQAPADLLAAPSPESATSARAPSPKRPFSEISSSATSHDDGPEYRPQPSPRGASKKATPQPRTPSQPRSPSDKRAHRGRKTPVRPSELRNLGVDAQGLDPNRQSPVVRKLYKSKGKWYEVTGPGRPDWAEDEKEVIVSATPQSSKRSRASLSRHVQ
ncbi:hypothetical protein BST61_g3068 [Cercospora zeina]